MIAVLNLIMRILDIYYYIIIAVAIISWLIAFNVINLHNDLVRSIWTTLNKLTEPVLSRVRRYIPSFSGVDISPIIVILAIWFIKDLILTSIFPALR